MVKKLGAVAGLVAAAEGHESAPARSEDDVELVVEPEPAARTAR